MDATRIKLRYEQGYWTKSMVKNAVKKGVITKADYTEITGEEYEV